MYDKKYFGYAALLGIAMYALCLCFASARPRALPLPLQLVLTQPTFGGAWDPIALSPDGNEIAYTSCPHSLKDRSELERNTAGANAPCHIVIIAARGYDPHSLHTLPDGATPVWSHSGAFLAFRCGRDAAFSLCLWSKRSGSVVHFAGVHLAQYPFSTKIQWAFNDRYIVTAAANERLPDSLSYVDFAREPKTIRVFRSQENLQADPVRDPYAVSEKAQGSLRFGNSSALLAVDIITRHVLRLLDLTSASSFEIAPGKPYVVVSHVISQGGSSPHSVASAVVLDVRNGATVATYRNTPSLNVTWSPDSQFLGWLGTTPNGSTNQVFVAALSGNVIRTISAPPEFGANVGDFQHILWDAQPHEILGVSASGHTVWGLDAQTGNVRSLFNDNSALVLSIVPTVSQAQAWSPSTRETITLYARDGAQQKDTFITTRLTAGSRIAYTLRNGIMPVSGQEVPNIVGAANAKVLAYFNRSITVPMDIFVLRANPFMVEQATNASSAYAGYKLGSSKMLSYTVRGHTLHAMMLLPPTYVPGRRVPTIVYPYGTSLKSQDFSFGGGETDFGTENLEVLVTRGFAILLPDVPYYDPYSPIEDDVKTIMAAVDAATLAGIADSNRLGIMGHSHGGFDVYAILVRTHRFKAAVSRAGYSDAATFFTEMDPDGRPYGITSSKRPYYGLGADMWSAPQRYLMESPLYAFPNITTPLLIVQGRNDTAVPRFNGEQAFVALRYLHKNVELVEYPHADHVESGWAGKDQLDYLERIIRWFQTYLR